MDQKNEDAKECRTSINKNHGAPFESVFHRKNEKQLAERIAAFRKKQEKKQQKIKRILEKREAKKAAGLLIEDANEVGNLIHCTELSLFIQKCSSSAKHYQFSFQYFRSITRE